MCYPFNSALWFRDYSCSSGWPQNCYIVEDDFELEVWPDLAFHPLQLLKYERPLVGKPEYTQQF